MENLEENKADSARLARITRLRSSIKILGVSNIYIVRIINLNKLGYKNT